MREIELKFKVDDLDKLLNKLDELGCNVSDVIYQEDSVFVSDLDNVESVDGSIWLRVRKMDDKIELNFKKQVSLNESQEIEFCVDDYDKATSFLEALGFKRWVKVVKRRRTSVIYNYCKRCNRCRIYRNYRRNI